MAENGNGSDEAFGAPLRVTIKLRVPVRHGDEVIHELELEEPTFDEMSKVDRVQGDMEKSIYLISAVTGLPPSVIKQLRARDIRRVNEEVEKFMGESAPEIGERPVRGSPTRSTGRPLN